MTSVRMLNDKWEFEYHQDLYKQMALSHKKLYLVREKKIKSWKKLTDPDRTRTCNLQIRSLALYPLRYWAFADNGFDASDPKNIEAGLNC